MTIFRTVPSPLTLNDNQSEQAIRVIKYSSNHATASNIEASYILLVRCHRRSGPCYQRFSPLGANAARFLPLGGLFSGGLFRKPLGPGYLSSEEELYRDPSPHREEIKHICLRGAILSSLNALFFTVTPLATMLSVLVMISTGKHAEAADIFTLFMALSVIKVPAQL